MSQTYQRVDLGRLTGTAATEGAAPPSPPGVPGEALPRALAYVRWSVIPISVLLCIAQAIVTVVATNRYDAYLTTSLLPVAAFGILFFAVAVSNPLARWAARLRRRRLQYPVGLGVAAAALGLAVVLLAPVMIRLLKATAKDPGYTLIVAFSAAAVLVCCFFLFYLVLGSRPLNRPELMCIFTAMMVTAGISTFGLTDQLVPLVATPFNPEWNTPQRGWQDQLNPQLNPDLYITDPAVVSLFRQGITTTAEGEFIRRPLETEGLGAHANHWLAVSREVPWAAWIKPLSHWLIFVGASYALFYSLTYLVLGAWSDREKLIFPLARLPESMLPEPQQPPGSMPALFKTAGFWIGFMIAFGIWGWNAGVTANWIAGGGAIPLGMNSGNFNELVRGTIWEGLGFSIDFPMMFLIIFTAIGIAFLLPLEISFSTWFYFLVGKSIILVLVWLGYGRHGDDFPSNFMWLNNAMTAQGGGGIFVFAAYALWRCLRDYARLVAGRSFADRLRIGAPVVGMVVSMLVLAIWISRNNVPFLWAVIFVLVTTLLTLGLMRVVAEGGIYWFQSHTSFFHLYKVFGVGAWGKMGLSAAVVGPLLPIYATVYMDIKTFLAPNLLNAAKMHKDVGSGRGKFHFNLLLCIVVSVVASLAVAIILAHVHGGNQMNSWFYIAGPQWFMDETLTAISRPQQFEATTAGWYGVGALWTTLSLIVRRTLFWFPHPIGYIMLINPLMAQLWFSFFIGWVCKKVVVKYGGKATFDSVRTIFIGLVLGELMAVFVWGMMQLVTGLKFGVTLNRYG